MSALLLDTHAFLWWIGGDPRLGARTQARVGASNVRVFVSAASVWEMAIKRALGKLAVPDDLASVIKGEGFEALSVEVHHAEVAGALPPIHRDPFDRLLIAQGVEEDMVLVTADADVVAYGTPTLDASA